MGRCKTLLRGWFGGFCATLSVCLLMGCDGCREQAGALLTGDMPALPQVTSWETHLLGFSMVSVKSPRKPLRYHVDAACPLRYAFMLGQRSNAAVVQKRKAPRRMVETRLYGELMGRMIGAGRWQLVPLWLRVQQDATTQVPDPLLAEGLLKDGAMVLKTDGQAWELEKGTHALWDGPRRAFVLSHFWPELARQVGGHAKDIKRAIPGGSLRARSFIKHWLLLQGERVGVMVDQMQVKRKSVQLDHRSEYAMLARGHLLYAQIRRRSWVLDPGRGDEGRTETIVEGELRLRNGCHKLKLAPFVAKLTPAERLQVSRARRLWKAP